MRLDHLLSKESGTRIRNEPMWTKGKGSFTILFNFEGPEGTSKEAKPYARAWGCSSAGRAPALQAGGQEFDPPHLHQKEGA